jgi:catechol 2,3-dioxygenase-like lactoylglutathione lyase family enzyme
MIRHVAGVGEVVEDVGEAARFYRDVLGLEVEHEAGSDYADVRVPGLLHYGLWARTAAAEAIYGSGSEAGAVPLGFVFGFEVDDVDAAYQALLAGGATVVQPPKTEPWGQKVCRFLAPNGAISELAETPWARRITQDLQAGEA